MAKREVKNLLLRLSPEMWDALASWAEDELRSVNSQIEYVLREALVKNRRLPRARKEAGDTGSHAPESPA